MRSRTAVLVVAAALTACTDAPTSMARQQAPAQASAALSFIQQQWTVTRLPFRPGGINNAGAIVGSLVDEAIHWQDGTMRVLLHDSSLAQTQLNRRAVAINTLGQVAGYAGRYGLRWASPTQAAQSWATLSSEYGPRPVAINDNDTMILHWVELSTGAVIQVAVYKPNVENQGIDVVLNGERKNKLRGINANGYIAGTAKGMGMSIAVRWDPQRVPTLLPTFGGQASGEAINSRGDVLGWSGLGATIWRLDGTFTTVSGLPAASSIASWNDAGRIVGNEAPSGRAFTFMNGTVTYLPLLDEGNPKIVGMNACGWIIGTGAGDTGYLWKRSGATSGCDAPLPATVMP